MNWGSFPDWITAILMVVVVWELWRNPKKPHFGFGPQRPYSESDGERQD